MKKIHAVFHFCAHILSAFRFMQLLIKRLSFGVFVLFVLCVSNTGRAAEQYGFGVQESLCESVSSTLSLTEARLRELKQNLELSRELYQGHLSKEMATKDMFAVDLLNQLQIDSYLSAPTPQLPPRLKLENASANGCEKEATTLKAQHTEYQRLWNKWKEIQRNMLSAPLYLRSAVLKLLDNRLLLASQMLEIEAEDPVKLGHKTELLKASEALLLLYRQWLIALLDMNLDPGKLLALYTGTLQILAEQESTISTAFVDVDLSKFRNEEKHIQYLKEHINLLHLVSFKFLHEIRKEKAFSQLGSPLVWSVPINDLLLEEVRNVPMALHERYISPYFVKLGQASDVNELYSVILTWALELLGSILFFYFTYRIAILLPSRLSKIQQNMFQRIENQVTNRVLASLFWFLKANVTWISIIAAVVLVVNSIPDDWYVFGYIEFWGIAFALIRALDVIFEWLLDRAITNSGQYMTPKLVASVGRGAERFAVITVISWMPVWLLISVNAYFALIVAIAISLLMTWLFAVRLLIEHDQQVDKFIFSKVFILSSEALADRAIAKTVYVGLRPVFFLVAQVIDSVHSLNQRLMYFDSYRALSVRIMRMRLETKEEKEPEEEELLEPDQSYSSWVLREVDVTSEWIDAPNIEHLYQPIKNWKEGSSDDNVLYIIGDAGSGRTSLARHLEKNWQETHVHYCKVPAKTVTPDALYQLLASALSLPSLSSVSELVKLENTIEPRVVVLDDAHNLFLSDVGKLEAYRAFIQCLNAQVENVFWVVTMNSSSWNYLDCVFNRELRVSHIYQMQKWTPGEIRSLILSRHKGGRRKLKYDEMLLSAIAKNEYTNVRAADSRLFNIVWEQSQGNPKVALNLWVSAARSKNRIVEIGMPQKPEAALLKTIKDDLCFIFAAIVTHDSMTSQEIMSTTSYSDAIVRHAIKQGLNMGILERLQDRRYCVTALWHKTLSQFLTSKNMI